MKSRQTRDLTIYLSLTKDISTLSLSLSIHISTCQLPKKFNPFARNKTRQTHIYTLGNVISATLLKVGFFQACSKHFRKQRQSATTNGIQFPQIKIQSPSSVSRILHTSKHDHDLSREKRERRGREKRGKKREREREREVCVQMHRSVDYTRSPKIWNEHVRNVAAEPDEKERMINVRGAEMHTFALLSPSHRPRAHLRPSLFVKFPRSIVPSQFSGRLSAMTVRET